MTNKKSDQSITAGEMRTATDCSCCRPKYRNEIQNIHRMSKHWLQFKIL